MNQTFYTAPEEPREPELLPQERIDPVATGRHFSLIGLGYLWLIIGIPAGSYAIQFACLFWWRDALSAWWMNWVLSLVPLYCVGLPLLWLVLRRVPTSPHNPDYTNSYRVTSDKPRFTFGHWTVLLVIGLGCMYAGSLVSQIIMTILSAIMDYDYANGLNALVDGSPLWMTFVGTCVCAPLGEEFLFRKLLIDRTRGYGDMTAILLSGLLFALFHGNVFQLFYAFLLGMILAYVYTRSGNLWWCVAMHSAVNFLGCIVFPKLAELMPADGVSFTSPLQIFVTLFVIVWQYGMIIAALILVCALWNRRKLSRGTTPLCRENGPSLVLLNVGMIACLAVMALMMAVSLIPVGA